MPLPFSNWSWTQSESTVYISLPVRGAAAGKVDIVSTEQYLKVKKLQRRCSQYVRLSRVTCVQVHSPPYLFEAFLFQPVDEAASTARVTDTCVFISLPKKTSSLWKDLLSDAGLRRLKPVGLFALILGPLRAP